nr:YihY family inner membrane protein [Lysobacter pythonis]
MMSFSRFVGGRFIDDRLFEAAGSLAYITLFALVPLATVIFGTLSAFKVFTEGKWAKKLSDYIFMNFVPSSARAVEEYLLQFSENANALTVVGTVALVVSLLITLTSVEAIFNRIWRVPTSRPQLSRFLVYWTVLTLGAVFAVASLALSAQFFALAIFDSMPGQWLERLLLRATPILIELGAFATIYRVVPHRTVKWRHALAGAVLGVVGFELVKWGLGVFLGNFNTYERIYGSVALLPVLLMWIYLSWVAVLLGASFASSLSAFRYQPANQRLPEGYEIYGMLRMLGRFHLARGQGRGLHIDEIRRLDPILTDSLVQEMLSQLSEAGILARAEGGDWLLARDLGDVTLAELYSVGRLRIPIHEAHLPCKDDVLGRAVLEVLDDVRLPLRDLLKRRVSSVYETLPRATEETVSP